MNTNLLDDMFLNILGKPVHARLRSFLLKTGQTTSYVTGDDGYYQKGIAKRYEVLTLGQYSGVTNITLNSKTDAHSNNCVLDLETGRMWSRNSSVSVGPTSDGKLPWTTNGSGEGVFPYCINANIAGLSGYSDWRIPNIFELFSLFGIEPPAKPDVVAFPSLGNIIHSSTTRPDSTGTVLGVNFTACATLLSTKTATAWAMLVRGG